MFTTLLMVYGWLARDRRESAITQLGTAAASVMYALGRHVRRQLQQYLQVLVRRGRHRRHFDTSTKETALGLGERERDINIPSQTSFDQVTMQEAEVLGARHAAGTAGSLVTCAWCRSAVLFSALGPTLWTWKDPVLTPSLFVSGMMAPLEWRGGADIPMKLLVGELAGGRTRGKLRARL